MIEAIKRIGEYAVEGNLTPETFLEHICQKLPETKPNKKDNDSPFKQHVVILDFNTNNNKIGFDFEEINAGGKDTSKKYLWIGNNSGNKDQIFFTTDNPIYLFTKSLANIKDRVKQPLDSYIEKILNEFFMKENGNYAINPSKFVFFKEKVNNMHSRLAIIEKNTQSLNTKKDVQNAIKELKSICIELNTKCDISLKTNIEEVKEKILLKCNELKNFNIDEKLEETYKKDILNRAKPQHIKRESAITNDFLDLKSLSKDTVTIYTVKFNGEPLVNRPEYREMVYYEKLNSLFDPKNKNYKKNFISEGKCSICGKENTATTSNTTNLEFKFYNNDKVGFSSKLDGKFTKNYNICKDCYQYQMIAENLLLPPSNLYTQIGGLDVFIIPYFILKGNNWDIKETSKYIRFSTNSIVNLNSLEDFQIQLEKYDAFKNYFIINYLFYHHPPGSSEFKILRLMKDVPPSRLDIIRRIEQDISNLIDDFYGGNKNLKIDLNQIWGSIPVKKGKKGNYSGFSRYLDIIDDVFSDKNVDYIFLINQFTETIRIIKFKREGYNIWVNNDFTNKILQLNFMLLFFKKLGILRGVNMNETEMSNINISGMEYMLPKGILDYWKDIKIYGDDSKKALFLLGYLIGEIGNAQSVKEYKNKPILNKITFQGMGIEKLRQLTIDVLEKLRQNKSRDGKTLFEHKTNEDIYSVLKILIDNKIFEWNLSNQENVFYTLSGYGFSNYLVRKRSKDKYFEELKKISDYIEKAKEGGKNTEEEESILKEAKELGENYKYYEARKILENIKIPTKIKGVE